MLEHADVIVIGGGPVGAFTALKLAQQGQQVALIESRSRDAIIQDARALALSWYSYQLLSDCGVWTDAFFSTPVYQIHMSQQDGGGRTLLDCQDLRLPCLGQVIDYPILSSGLTNALEQNGVTVLWSSTVRQVKSLQRYAVVELETSNGQHQTLSCRLAIMAEGGTLSNALPTPPKAMPYHQQALVAHVTMQRPMNGTAYERFTHNGPLALLPYDTHAILVWSLPEHSALLTADPSTLAHALASALGNRLGSVESIRKRGLFPLQLRQQPSLYQGRIVTIGNAAQILHPIAAQGLNLGLRDGAILSHHLAYADDPAEVLAAYAADRQRDRQFILGFTHSLVRVFETHAPFMRTLRGIGMNALDLSPVLRRTLSTPLIFGC